MSVTPTYHPGLLNFVLSHNGTMHNFMHVHVYFYLHDCIHRSVVVDVSKVVLHVYTQIEGVDIRRCNIQRIFLATDRAIVRCELFQLQVFDLSMIILKQSWEMDK